MSLVVVPLVSDSKSSSFVVESTSVLLLFGCVDVMNIQLSKIVRMTSMFSGVFGCGDWTDNAECDGGEILGVCSAALDCFGRWCRGFCVYYRLMRSASTSSYIFSRHGLELVSSQWSNGKIFLQ